MKNYHYIAHERRGHFKDRLDPSRDEPTDTASFASPDEIAVYIARKIVPLGDGRRRLAAMAQAILDVQRHHDERIAARVAEALTP